MILFFSILIFIFSYYLYKKYISLTDKKLKLLLDRPTSSRNLHTKETPTSGGIIFGLIAVLSGLFFEIQTLIITSPLIIVGFFDDIFKLSSKIRLFFQIFVSIFLLNNLRFISFINYKDVNVTSFLIIFILTFFSTAIINFTNFMDGSDGLVGGVFFIFFIYLAFFHNILYLPFALSILAFLIFNWSPAKIFMGDSGSTYLGSLLIAICFGQKTLNSAIGLFLIVSPLYIDALFTLKLRFFYERKKIFRPHKKHFYQRMISNGCSKKKIALFFSISTLINSIAYESVGLTGVISCVIFELMIGLFLNRLFALPFKKD